MDARTIEDLEQITRERLDDLALSKPRWTSAFIVRALNEAEREAAERGRLLRDDTSSKTVLTVVADTATYLLDPAFFELIDVRNLVTGVPLQPVTLDALNARDDRWRTRTCSTADAYLVEQLPNERLRLRLVGIPSEDTELQLEVYRYPYFEMEAGDEPELAPRHHEGLVDWACYRCFNVRDSDGYDPKKAADHLADFTRNFGQKPDANVHRKQRETSRHVVTPRSF